MKNKNLYLLIIRERLKFITENANFLPPVLNVSKIMNMMSKIENEDNPTNEMLKELELKIEECEEMIITNLG
jgi:hypothetical protein